MSRPALSVCVPPATPVPMETQSSGEHLLRTFNDLRDELVSTLWYLLGNQEDAQDAAQEAFLRCWRTQESLADVQNVRAWVFRVALNVAKDVQRSAWKRRVKPLGPVELIPLVGTTSPSDCVESQETLERLRVALRQLRPEEQEVFLLRQNGELTYEQIAELFDRPVGTVKTQMRAALQKLRQVLSPEE